MPNSPVNRARLPIVVSPAGPAKLLATIVFEPTGVAPAFVTGRGEAHGPVQPTPPF